MRNALIDRADELIRISGIELAQARSLREELRIARVTTANAIRELADVRLRIRELRSKNLAVRCCDEG